MERINVTEDTFLYDGVEHYFPQMAFSDMDAFEKYLIDKEAEGYTKCFFHKSFNTKEGDPNVLKGKTLCLVMFKLFK